MNPDISSTTARISEEILKEKVSCFFFDKLCLFIYFIGVIQHYFKCFFFSLLIITIMLYLNIFQLILIFKILHFQIIRQIVFYVMF